MKIVVIVGTGLIGSELSRSCARTATIRWRRRRTRASTRSPVRGWPQRSRAPRSSWTSRTRLTGDDAAVLHFFQTAARNLLAEEAVAGVQHHVALSVVGADRLPDSGYLRAKLAQEQVVKTATVPYTILRATQFFEFIGRIADSSTVGDTVRLPPVQVQPEAADDAAAALADVAVSAPVNGTVELAGPERSSS